MSTLDSDRLYDMLATLEACECCGVDVPSNELVKRMIHDKESRGRIMNVCGECELDYEYMD